MVDVRVCGCEDVFVDLGLDLAVLDGIIGFLLGGPLACFTDLDLRFKRGSLVVGFGVTGIVSEPTVVVRFTDRLRGRLLSATAFIDLSENAETGGRSSWVGLIVTLDLLFLLNIPRNPPFDSGRSNFKGNRLSASLTPLRCTGGGRVRRLKPKLD